METGIPDRGVTQYDDSSVTAEAGSHQTVIRLEQPKESPWKQPAVYLAILAFLVAFWAEREARLSEYYGVDLEVFIAKQGLHPPPDPWGHFKTGDHR